ncbi:MAG TPA: hypothetical protein VGE52_10865 [Pirellulales bacterium]
MSDPHSRIIGVVLNSGIWSLGEQKLLKLIQRNSEVFPQALDSERRPRPVFESRPSFLEKIFGESPAK